MSAVYGTTRPWRANASGKNTFFHGPSAPVRRAPKRANIDPRVIFARHVEHLFAIATDFAYRRSSSYCSNRVNRSPILFFDLATALVLLPFPQHNIHNSFGFVLFSTGFDRCIDLNTFRTNSSIQTSTVDRHCCARVNTFYRCVGPGILIGRLKSVLIISDRMPAL